MMKKFKVSWYQGSVTSVYSVLDERIVEAKNMAEVNPTCVLPESEKETYKTQIKFCMREIHLEKKKHSFDYGSYSRFVMVEEIGRIYKKKN